MSCAEETSSRVVYHVIGSAPRLFLVGCLVQLLIRSRLDHTASTRAGRSSGRTVSAGPIAARGGRAYQLRLITGRLIRDVLLHVLHGLPGDEPARDAVRVARVRAQAVGGGFPGEERHFRVGP